MPIKVTVRSSTVNRERRKSFTAAPILAVLAVVLVTVGAYVAGYFWLGAVANVKTPAGPVAVRIFRYRWQAVIFTPAARVDSLVRRIAVEVSSNEEISQIR
jgi:hypothetical protein